MMTKNWIKVVLAYLLAILSSAVFSPLFGKFYLWVIPTIPGDGFGVWGDWHAMFLFQSTIFALPFFLPLFVFILVSSKKWLVWLIGIFIPFTMFLVGGKKHILWFLIFTIVGIIIGWLVNLVIKKAKK